VEINIVVRTVHNSDFLILRDLLPPTGETGYSLNMIIELASADIECLRKGFAESQFKVVYIMAWFEDGPFFVIDLIWLYMYLR
jgi:hypothetical protein